MPYFELKEYIPSFKNGGILSTIKIAQSLIAKGHKIHIGSHVGESSLLTASARIVAAKVNHESLEGSFGLFLLEEDVTENALHFGASGCASLKFENDTGLGIIIKDKFL